MAMILGSRRRSSWCGIQESDAAGEFAIRAAPRHDPGLNAEELEIPAREIRPDLSQLTALNRSDTVLWKSRGYRYVANAARTAGLTASRTKSPPARHLFTADEVGLDAGEGRQEGAPDFAIEQADLGRAENRAGILGKPLLESSEGWCAFHVRL
jgi:hypothetical protein